MRLSFPPKKPLLLVHFRGDFGAFGEEKDRWLFTGEPVCQRSIIPYPIVMFCSENFVYPFFLPDRNVIYSNFFVKFVFPENSSKYQAYGNADNTKNKHNEGSARTFSCSKYSCQRSIRICVCHPRLTNFIHHEAASKSTYGNGKKLHCVPTGINPPLHFRWNSITKNHIEAGTHYWNDRPPNDLSNTPPYWRPCKCRNEIFCTQRKQHCQNNDPNVIFRCRQLQFIKQNLMELCVWLW